MSEVFRTIHSNESHVYEASFNQKLKVPDAYEYEVKRAQYSDLWYAFVYRNNEKIFSEAYLNRSKAFREAKKIIKQDKKHPLNKRIPG